MKINALVRGMSLIEYGWIHEEGLIILNKVLCLGNVEDSPFVAYNIDRDKYSIIRGDQFIPLDDNILQMTAIVDGSSLPEGENIIIEIYIEGGSTNAGFYEDLKLYASLEYDEDLELYTSLEYDEDLEHDEDYYGEIVLDDLNDLYSLMSKGWSETSIDKLIEDLLSLGFDEDPPF